MRFLKLVTWQVDPFHSFERSLRKSYCLLRKTPCLYCREIHCSRGRQLLSIFFFPGLKQFYRWSETMVFEKRRSDIAAVTSDHEFHHGDFTFCT